MFLTSCARPSASLARLAVRRASLLGPKSSSSVPLHQFFSTSGEENDSKLSSEAVFPSVPFAERIIRVKRRTEDGKYAARRHRRNGEVPGVLYGGSRRPKKFRKSEGGDENDHVLVYAVDNLAIEKELRLCSHSFFCLPYQLHLEDEDEYIPVLPRSFQRHPVNREIMSLSYQRLDRAVKPPKIAIPVSYVDEDRCPGLKLGGYLNQDKRFVKCEIVGSDFDSIPSQFVVSLLNLETVDRIKVLDVVGAASEAAGISLVDKPNVHLASIVGRKGKAAEAEEDDEEELFII